MSILTISRVPGSGGNEVARKIAEARGLSLLDRIAIDRYIQEHPEYPTWVKRMDEHSPTFKDRGSERRDSYLDILNLIVLETALKDNSVILGRGSQFLLQNVPGVFHVRLICSEERGKDRVSLLLADEKAPINKIYKKMKSDREGFYRYYFHSDGNDPTFYDLVINTDRVSQERVIELIGYGLDHTLTPELTQHSKRELNDRYLAQKIQNRILYENQLSVSLLEVNVKNGKATLSGSVVSDQITEACITIAQEEEGITDVESLIYLYIPGRYSLY